MNLQQLLNADVRTIGQMIRQGWAWWGQELSELVPPSLRRRGAQTSRWVARMAPDGAVRLWRDGAPDRLLTGADGGGRAVDLILPEGSALVRDLMLPRLSAADLRRLIELNLDRYTPFTADQVYFDAQTPEPPTEDGRQRVWLGVVPRDRATTSLARATALGLKPERLGLPEGLEPPGGQFDFLRSIRAENGGDPAGRRRLYMWTACGVLAAANVLAAVLRDSNDVGALQQVVDAQQPTVTLALKLRKGVEGERNRRLALLTRRSANEPLRILDAVTRALPAGEWVERFEWNGHAVRLVGFKPPNVDLLSALHGPALTNPRSMLSDMPTKMPTGVEPFDVMADATQGRRR